MRRAYPRAHTPPVSLCVPDNYAYAVLNQSRGNHNITVKDDRCRLLATSVADVPNTPPPPSPQLSQNFRKFLLRQSFVVPHAGYFSSPFRHEIDLCYTLIYVTLSKFFFFVFNIHTKFWTRFLRVLRATRRHDEVAKSISYRLGSAIFSGAQRAS